MKFLKSKLFLAPLALVAAAVIIYTTTLAFRGEILIPNMIRIGDLQFRIYGIILMLSVLASAGVLERIFKIAVERNENLKKTFEKFDFYEVLLWSIIPGIIFARIFYFLSNIENYENFVDVIKVWQGGMSIFGAIIGGVIGILIYLKRAKIPVFPILDYIFIVIPFGHALGRWANFINQEIYGPPTDLPWKMYVAPAFRTGIPAQYASSDFFHPLFLYEFLLNLLLFGILFLFFKKGTKKFNGFFIATYALGYGIVRFIIEFLRFDPKVLVGLSVAQIVSLLMVFVSIGFLIYKLALKKENAKS